MIRSDTMHTAAAEKVGGTPSAQAWFAGGERVGYDPKARAMVVTQGAYRMWMASFRANQKL